MKLIMFGRDTDATGRKKRIYIAGAPGSGALLKGLAKSILGVCDCECYIDIGGDESDPSDRSVQIEQMDLAVFAVTKAFLTAHCPGREFDLVCAREKNIPILPILCEAGLETLFSRVCGHYHLLDARKEEFSYELSEYLTSRFDDYIRLAEEKDPVRYRAFLSYRKKDRSEAVKLLGMIQSYPVCLDTAVWFDDFLTKGENYDRNIDAALRGADFVLLAVTPSVLEASGGAPNYVESIEYPHAQAYGKPIIAVEMQPVDRREFARRFPKAVLVSPRELGNVLGQLYGRPCTAPPVIDAETACNLGKLYLKGERVYKNPGLGCRLLQEASRHGSWEADWRLAKICAEGIIADRDYDNALRYYEQCAVRIVKESQGLTAAGKAGGNYFISLCICQANMLLEYSELCRRVCRDPGLRRKILITNSSDYIKVCELLRDRGMQSERVNPGNGLLELGCLNSEDGNAGEALRMFDLAEEYFDVLFPDRKKLFPASQLARLYSGRGKARMYQAKALSDPALFAAGKADLEKGLSYSRWIERVYGRDF